MTANETDISPTVDLLNTDYHFLYTDLLDADRMNSLLSLIREVELHDSYPPRRQRQHDESAETYFLKRHPVFRILALAKRNDLVPRSDQELAGHVSGDPVVEGHEAQSQWMIAVGANDVSQLIEVGTLLVRPTDRNRRLSIDLINIAVAYVVASGHYAVAATALDNVRSLRALVSSGFYEVAVLDDKKNLPFRYLALSEQLR